MFKKNKKGQVYVLFLYLMAILMIGLAISIIMKPMQVTYDQAYDDPDVSADEYQQFFTRSVTFWKWLPLPIGIVLIVWMYIKANERDQF